jgi:uncharacterized protein (TIGR02145 family)
MTENLATTKNQKRGTTLTTNNSGSYDPQYTLPSTSGNSTGLLSVADAQNSNYYGNNEGKPGFFYNWAAAVGAESGTDAQNTTSYPACSDCNPPVGTVNVASQDICPTGWHLPSDWEWNNLEKEINNSYTQYSTASIAPTTWSDTYRMYNGWRGGHGTLMRNTTNTDPSITLTYEGLSNSPAKGFAGLMIGYAGYGNWVSYGTESIWWTASSQTNTGAIERELASHHVQMARLTIGVLKNQLRSVRCMKYE